MTPQQIIDIWCKWRYSIPVSFIVFIIFLILLILCGHKSNKYEEYLDYDSAMPLYIVEFFLLLITMLSFMSLVGTITDTLIRN